MTKAPVEMGKYVKSQNFTSTQYIVTAMKDIFKVVLQQIMECELADELGYEKCRKSERLM